MTLRVRVALALVAVVVPLALALALLSWRARREAVLDVTYAATVARMEAGGRERCEARDAAAAIEGADTVAEDDETDGVTRGRARRAARPARLGIRGLRARGGVGAGVLATYDAELLPSEPDAPRLPDDVAAALRAGEVAVLVPSPRGSARVAVRMPWDEGPCAVVLVEARRGAAVGERGAIRDLVVALGVLAAAVFAAMLALGPALRRLGLLASAVRASGAGRELALPPAVRGGDEIGGLASALEAADKNVREHVTRLEARDRALRDYVDGTTHDIALPLTVLQGHLAGVAERARSGVTPDEADVDGAIAASHYLGQLSANLAAAARLDGSAPLERRDVDLGAVATRVSERLGPIARHRHVEVACSVPDAPVIVSGDELLLERAIANLAHNAIRHRLPASADTPGHLAILVEARGRGAGPRVRVLSDGDRISDTVLETLRRGEVPPDPARTRGRGLGLRIVRQVADAHAMQLTFERGEDGGLAVALEPRPA